jgi:hypothetical protein
MTAVRNMGTMHVAERANTELGMPILLSMRVGDEGDGGSGQRNDVV